MAIVVDKEQKRKDIALACRDLFAVRGFTQVTISEIAKVAGVGKGTLYEYFKNKEEIVFELVELLLQEYTSTLQEELLVQKTVRDKVKKFAEFFYIEETEQLRKLYKGFLALSLTAPSEELQAFQTACFNSFYFWFAQLFVEGVKSGELIEESLGLTKGVFVTAKGMFVSSCTTNIFGNLQEDLNTYIDNLFNIIEVKK
ncbi:MAG: TetR/AcrR family transcriptional regulator [Campylobacterales bacterium]|nr:TetR/AcrR family transcriptional regulator [Campylobacterales bacterium]